MGNPIVYNDTTNRTEDWCVLNTRWKVVSDLPAQEPSTGKRPKLFQVLYFSSQVPEFPGK